MKQIKQLLKKIIFKFRLTFLIRIKNDIYHFYQYTKLYKYFRISDKESRKIQYIENSKKIWVFWWQGESNMPPIVKACYNSVLRHSKEYEVVLVTKYNYSVFTNIDENILDKLYKNRITLTAFSDVMRFNLLKNNGGLWIDATVYLNEDINEKYFDKFFTIGINDILHGSVNGGYSGFFIGGSNNRLIEFMNRFFINYYKDNDVVHYYFMIDEALNYCYKKNIDGFKNYVDNNSFNSDSNLHELQPMLNNEYNENIYIKSYNRFFKLTYKMDFDDEHDTFYHRLLHEIEPFS